MGFRIPGQGFKTKHKAKNKQRRNPEPDEGHTLGGRVGRDVNLGSHHNTPPARCVRRASTHPKH